MLWPSSASGAFAKVFYDKPVEIIEAQKTLDDEGGMMEFLSTKAEILANVNFSQLGKAFEELGAKLNASVAITTKKDAPVEIGDKMRIDGKLFEAVEVKRFDSHTLILGRTL